MRILQMHLCCCLPRRILNRLSRDLDEMDYNLAMYQQQLGNCVMRLLATIAFLCFVQPAFVGGYWGEGGEQESRKGGKGGGGAGVEWFG